MFNLEGQESLFSWIPTFYKLTDSEKLLWCWGGLVLACSQRGDGPHANLVPPYIRSGFYQNPESMELKSCLSNSF